jgi:hypothetical protein
MAGKLVLIDMFAPLVKTNKQKASAAREVKKVVEAKEQTQSPVLSMPLLPCTEPTAQQKAAKQPNNFSRLDKETKNSSLKVSLGRQRGLWFPETFAAPGRCIKRKLKKPARAPLKAALLKNKENLCPDPKGKYVNAKLTGAFSRIGRAAS